MGRMVNTIGYDRPVYVDPKAFNNWEKEIKTLASDFCLGDKKTNEIVKSAKGKYKDNKDRYWYAQKMIMSIF